MIIDVIIPAFNEENAVGKVVSEIPKDLVRQIVVVNNASTDDTRMQAQAAGATVIEETRKGYGYACLAGIAHLKKQKKSPDMVVFLDADASDYPEEMRALIQPILQQNYDMVIGSRALGTREKGAMTLPQRVGNVIATQMLHQFYKIKFTDLGPFRAILYPALLSLDMQDTTYGWTVEMQAKAAKKGLRCTEIPVSYKKRIGKSKISGTVKGVVMAGYKIIYTILKYR